jgi:hypothetical protein
MEKGFEKERQVMSFTIFLGIWELRGGGDEVWK